MDRPQFLAKVKMAYQTPLTVDNQIIEKNIRVHFNAFNDRIKRIASVSTKNFSPFDTRIPPLI